MSRIPPKILIATWKRIPLPLRRRLRSPSGRRLMRFAPAAVLALLATQTTYFICVSVVHTTGRVSGFAGWFAGAMVSYVMSRWAWERRGKPQLLKETLPFVSVSLIVGATLTEVSHFAYAAAQRIELHSFEFDLFVQGLYIAANGVLFIARFIIFNYVIFANRATTSTS